MRIANFRQFKPLDYAGTEALNTICANLSFAGKNMKKIVMTSCNAGDGKSYLTLRIAQNLASRGKNIVVVDADLRRSRMIQRHKVEVTGEITGLAHYLAGYSNLEDVVYKTNMQGVYIIPIGQYVANPIPLFNSPDFSELLDMLAQSFDMVLVDAPPIGLVIDAAEIAQCCDGCVLVLEYEKSRRHEAMMAKHQLEQTGVQILGCILNKVSFDTISSQKYYNQSYYSHYDSLESGSSENEKGKGKRKKRGDVAG